MIIEEVIEPVSTTLKRQQFGIVLNQVAFKTLISNIYPDINRTVLMELYQNAYDSQRRIGKENIPVKITLPTIASPVLIVEDCGEGMTEEFVMERYTKLFDSSKRDSNDQDGGYGIGRISALGLGENYTLISSRGGMRHTYSVFYNERGIPDIAQINTEYVPSKETGVTVIVNINLDDVSKIQKAAETVFYFVDVQPEFVNADFTFKSHKDEKWDYEDDSVKFILADDKNRYDDSSVKCLMGLYGYNVDNAGMSIFKYSNDLGYIKKIIFKAPLGTVQPVASRDRILINKKSDEFFAGAIERLKQTLITYFSNAISSAPSVFEAYKKRQKFYSVFHYDSAKMKVLPSEWNGINFDSRIFFKTTPILCVTVCAVVDRNGTKKLCENRIQSFFEIKENSDIYFDDCLAEDSVKTRNRIKNGLHNKESIIVISSEGFKKSNSAHSLDVSTLGLNINLLSSLSSKPVVLNKGLASKSNQPKVNNPPVIRWVEGVVNSNSRIYNFSETVNISGEVYFIPSFDRRLNVTENIDCNTICKFFDSKKKRLIKFITSVSDKFLKNCPNIKPYKEIINEYNKEMADVPEEIKYLHSVGAYRITYEEKTGNTEFDNLLSYAKEVCLYANVGKPTDDFKLKMSKYEFLLHFLSYKHYLTTEEKTSMINLVNLLSKL